MKKLLIIITLLTCAGSVKAQVSIPRCAGTNDTAAFQAIITAAAGTPRTIEIPRKSSAQRCALNTITFPSTITLNNTNGSGINRLAGQTITVQGPVISPRQIFFGTGTTSFSGNTSISTIDPTWWGTVGDWNGSTGTDNGAALVATLIAAKTIGNVKVLVPPGAYKSTLALSMANTSGLKLIGPGAGGTNSPVGKQSAIIFDVAGSDPLIDVSSSDSSVIEDLELRYVNASFTGDVIGPAIGSTIYGLHVDHVFIGGTLPSAINARSGINVGNGNTIHIKNVQFYYMHFGVSNFNTSYSNEITIEKCWFAQLAYYGIANPYFAWTIISPIFEPNADGKTFGIVCAVNEAGVPGGAGAGPQCISVTMIAPDFWDDSASGGINIDYAGSGLKLYGGHSTNSSVGVVKTFLRLRTAGNGFDVRGNTFDAAGGSIFIDNNTVKMRGFCESSNTLVPESGTITQFSSPGHLLSSVSCGPMQLTTAQITTRAAQYVGEEADHKGVSVFDTTLNVPKVWDGAFRIGVTQFSNYGETLAGTCTLNLNSASVQDCFTNTTGKTLVVTRAVFRTATPGVFNGGTTNWLFIKESAGGTFLGDGVAVTGANNAASFKIIQTSIGTTNTPRVIANGAKVQVAVDLAYGSAQTCTVDIFGYFY